jgi:hypothetical protein
MVFLGPRANAELVPKFHVALHSSHAALPMVTLKTLSYTNVTLIFFFDFGLDHPCSWGIWVMALYTEKKESNCQTKKIKIGARHQDELADRSSVAI